MFIQRVVFDSLALMSNILPALKFLSLSSEEYEDIQIS
jgi:hypothetical protein